MNFWIGFAFGVFVCAAVRLTVGREHGRAK